MSREKEIGERKISLLNILKDGDICVTIMAAHLLPFVFFLFNISFHTTAFLWSHSPSQQPPAEHAAAGTCAGRQECDNRAHEAKVSSGCCIQRDTPNGIAYSWKTSPLESPRQRASNSTHTETSRKCIRVKSGIKGPWSYHISWLSGTTKRKHGYQYSDPVLIMYHHSCCLPL